MKLAASKHHTTKVRIHTIVTTQIGILQACVGLDTEENAVIQEWLINESCVANLNNIWVADSTQVEHVG